MTDGVSRRAGSRAPRTLARALLLAALAAGCGAATEDAVESPAGATGGGAGSGSGAHDTSAARPLGAYARVDSLLAAEPLAAGDTIRVTGVAAGLHSTVVLIQLAPGAVVPGHVHRDHDEAVHVVRGSCTMVLGDRRLALETGSVVLAPALTPHGARAGPRGCAVISTYSPLWNPEDRHPDPRGDP